MIKSYKLKTEKLDSGLQVTWECIVSKSLGIIYVGILLLCLYLYIYINFTLKSYIFS